MKTSAKRHILSAGLAAFVIAFFLPSSADAADGHSLMGLGWDNDGQLGQGGAGEYGAPVLVASNVTMAAAGSYHTLFLTTDGNAHALGDNTYGQLGDGSYAAAATPVNLGPAGFVEAGGETSYWIAEGFLKGSGANYDQELQPSGERVSTPVIVAANVAKVAAGDGHVLYLTTTGALYARGRNDYGQIGNNDTFDVGTPFKVADDVVAIAAGGAHSLFVSSDRHLYAMGANTAGQLGINSTTNSHTPVEVDTNVVSVAAGGDNSFYIKDDGTLWGMGYNGYGQLGRGDLVNATVPFMITRDVASVTAGPYFCLFVKTDGTLWGMGFNGKGQLGRAQAQQGTPFLIARGVRAVSAGSNHTVFLTDRLSPYAPTDRRGAKWSDLGWMDDTYYPWVYNYRLNFWYYVYDDLAADVDACHWIFYYTSDMSDYGWGYVYPDAGWWCFDSDMNAVWLSLEDPLP